MSATPKPLGPCPLCGREMIDGPSVNERHWVPKSEGGGPASPMHKVCHRFIHELFGEAELARSYATPEALRAHPDVATFIAWVRKKPPEFIDWPKSPRNPRKGRRKPSPIVYPAGR